MFSLGKLTKNELITNDAKRLQKLDELILYPYGTGAGIVTGKNTHEHNPNRLQTIDHPYRILIFEGSRFVKTNALLNLINQQATVLKSTIQGKGKRYWWILMKRFLIWLVIKSFTQQLLNYLLGVETKHFSQIDFIILLCNTKKC